MSAPLATPPRAPEPADAELVARALDGDELAYAALVRRHQQLLYRLARGLGLDHDTSLDVVQDAFVRAHERLASCRDGASFRPWLARICRNLCLDQLRDVRRLTTPLSQLDGGDELEDVRGGAEELALTLRAALERLPHVLREAFLLKHDAGYTYDEIAAIVEASPSAVKMRVHRAREALRGFLAGQGIGRIDAEADAGDDRAIAARLTPEGANHTPGGTAAVLPHPTHTRRIS